MPELPDVTLYIEALESHVQGRVVENIVVGNPFLIRSVEIPITDLVGHTLQKVKRVGKRIAMGFDGDVWLVVHLMIAGRLHWFKASGKKKPNKRALLNLVFDVGTVSLTEAGTKRRASLYVVRGPDVEQHDPGGLEPLVCSRDAFVNRLRANNHTLRRALTDPRILSGIGNAYSDEILHRAQLSPVLQTHTMTDDAYDRLFEATVHVLQYWTDELRSRAGGRGAWPKSVTAFQDGMAVHGRYGEPCPKCQTQVQRIRYATNETNYCPTCQTGGKLLADRGLSRLLKSDWPKTVEELETRLGR